MKKPRVIFVPADDNNLPHLVKFQNSLRKFHSEEELPLIRYDLKEVDDPLKWYKAKPLIARELLDEYEVVIGADADQIVLGDLSDIWQGEFDVATVLNDPSYPIGVWDIKPYYNNGLVVFKSKEFAEHWWRLCNTPHFNVYQYREQDLLNILCSDYFNYKVRSLDDTQVYGEFAKPFLASSFLKDNKVFFPIENKGELELRIWHSGGGNTPDKGNYRLRFPEEVIKYIEELIK